MLKMFKIVSVNLLLLTVGLIAVEILFGGWFREDPFRKLFVPTNINREYRLDGLYSGPEFIHYTRDGYGLRGRYSSPEKIDILTVGGSTTDQAYIDDSATWQVVLASELKRQSYAVNVVNAGIDGQSTFGHLKSFDWWFPNIPNFKPNCIIYYVGINDVFAERPIYEQHGVRGLIVEKSVLYKMLQILKGALLAKKYDIGHGRTDFESLTWTVTPLSDPTVYSAVFGDLLKGYEERLYELVSKTKGVGALPVFVTQQTRMSRVRDGRLEGVAGGFEFRGRRLNGVDRYLVLELFNDVTREVCRKTGSYCIDLSRDLEFEDVDFYDFMHNTPVGAQKVGRFLADSLVQNSTLMAPFAH